VHISKASWTSNPNSRPGKIYRKPKRYVSHAGHVDGYMLVAIAMRIIVAKHATTFYVPNLKRIVIVVDRTGAGFAAH